MLRVERLTPPEFKKTCRKRGTDLSTLLFIFLRVFPVQIRLRLYFGNFGVAK